MTSSTPLEWFYRDELACIAHADGVVLTRLSGSPEHAAFLAARRAFDAAVRIAGDRAVVLDIAQAGPSGMDRAKLASEIKQILRENDGRIAGGALVVRSSSDFVAALLRATGTAALLALRLRTRSFFIVGDVEDAVARLVPLRRLPAATLPELALRFDDQARAAG